MGREPAAPGQGLARCLFSSHARPDPVDLLDELVLAPYEVYIGEL